MEDNNSTELEEGEACCYKKEDDGNNIDPDIALSYIDEKIKNVLGHFQKDFEGGVTAENLGAKFGGYGSFLPTYERSPSIWSRQKSPERSNFIVKSPSTLPAEGTLRNSQAPVPLPPSGTLRNAHRGLERVNNAKLPSGDLKNIEQDSSLVTHPIPDQHLENGASNGSENKINQRVLKVRIKVGPDINTRKNVAIYNGLGLEASPSTSHGSSSEESEGLPPLSGGATDSSPANILQVMTSLPKLISPLHESLVSLVKKEILPTECQPVYSSKVGLVHDGISTDQSVEKMGNVKVSKQKEKESLLQNERLVEERNGNNIKFDRKMSFPMKKIKSKMLEGEGTQRSDIERTPLSSAYNIDEPAQTFSRASENLALACTADMKNRIVDEMAKRLKPSPHNGMKMQNGSKSLTVRTGQIRILSSQSDHPFGINEIGKLKGDKFSVLSKDCQRETKYEEDFTVVEGQLPRQKSGRDNISHEQNRADFSFQEEKPSSGSKKKSKHKHSDGKTEIRLSKERHAITVGVVEKDKKRSRNDVSPSKNKAYQVKSEKHSTKLTFKQGKRPVNLNEEGACPEAPSAVRQKYASNNFGTENGAVIDRSNERMGGSRVTTSSLFGTSKDVADPGPKLLMPNTIPAEAPVYTEDWVCCDYCGKWRLLPLGKEAKGFPDKWHCSMLDWLPERINCEDDEDAINAAVQALNPFPASQTQKHAVGSTSGVISSGDVQLLGENPQTFGSRAPNKLSSKEAVDASKSNGLSFNIMKKKKMLQESVKSKSLNDMNQLPTESGSLKRAEIPQSSKFNEMTTKALEKHIPNQKEKSTSKGDTKLLKVKRKRESNPCEVENPKRVKTDENINSAKHEDFAGEPVRLDLTARTPKSAMAISKNQYSESRSPKEQKSGGRERLLVSLKNLTDRAQVPVDHSSSGLKKCNQGIISVKKRKLKDFQDSQSHDEAFHYSAHDKLMDASDEPLFRKEKKLRALDISRQEVNDGNDRLNKEVSSLRDFASGTVDGLIDALDGVSERKDRHRKHRKMLVSQQTLDHTELMRGDTGHGQIPIAATSSSSKVSSSHKTRANCEVKGSPVESVSSSPFRFKLTEGRHGLTKGDINNGNVPAMNTVKKSYSKKVKGGSKLSRVVSEDNGHLPIPAADYPGNDELSTDIRGVDHATDGNKGCMNDRVSASYPLKSGDITVSRFKDKERSSASDFNRCKEKAVETGNKLSDANPVPTDKSETNYVSRGESVDHPSIDRRVDKLPKKYQFGPSEGRSNTRSGAYVADSPFQNSCHDSDNRARAASASGESRSEKAMLTLHPQGRGKGGTSTQAFVRTGLQLAACNDHLVGSSNNAKVPKDSLKDKTNGDSNGSEGFLAERQEFKDVYSSPSRANLSSLDANDVLKQAKDLKDCAVRLKNSCFGFESSEACFQAALKFLLGAWLLETSNGDNGKHGEMTPIQVYSTTAKLWESCATEFETRQEVAATALAYKCMEVAYLKVAYCKNSGVKRDCHELQAALHQGESPSSSASDLDNLNNQAAMDRPNQSKGAGSHAVGSHIVVARNRPSVVRLLDFTQDVGSAMEASRKSIIAFEKASSVVEGTRNREHITSLQRVIDSSFQDIGGLVSCAKLAWEAIGRSGFSGARD